MSNLEMSKIAIVSARGLGDALLTMTIAYNLHLKGYQVDFYSDVLSSMAGYFPDVRVLSFSEEETNWEALTKQYEFSAFADGMVCPSLVESAASRLFILNRDKQSRKVCYVESFAQQLRSYFSLDFEIVTMNNGLTMPAGFEFRKYSRRVILHPTSSNEKKDWPMEKFIALAQRLIRSGLEPVFILTEAEVSYQSLAKENGISFVCLSLKRLVPYLCESGAIVANDSGPGHLGAFTGISVISIFPKKSRTLMWSPVGENVTLVWPRLRLPGSNGNRYWKRLLSVSGVYRNVMRVVRTRDLKDSYPECH